MQRQRHAERCDDQERDPPTKLALKRTSEQRQKVKHTEQTKRLAEAIRQASAAPP
jgi:hypothetical protein